MLNILPAVPEDKIPAYREALLYIKDGRDVENILIAKTLREIEETNPELIWICRVMNDYAVDEKLPYFGAIATPRGLQVLRESGGEA